MLFIIPTGTDAPVYHWPIGTVAMMVFCTIASLVFWGQPMDPEIGSPYTLNYGQGLQPLQWMTSILIHEGPIHLATNLVFLWVFGLIVEGKIGLMGFLATFVGIGIGESAIEQALANALKFEGGSLGASSAIYGLMAMGMIWAPKNSLSCLTFFFFGLFRVFLWDVPVYGFALFYIVSDSAVAALFLSVGLSSSSALHLIGAVLGLIVGMVLLKGRLVDCEGWDVFSVMAGSHLKTVDEITNKTKRRRRSKKRRGYSRRTEAAQSWDNDDGSNRVDSDQELRSQRQFVRIRKALIEQGDPIQALSFFDSARAQIPDFTLPEDLLMGLIKALHTQESWADSIPLMSEYAQRFPDRAAKVQLKAAQILVDHLERPTAATRFLDAIPDGALTEQLDALCDRIRGKAQWMIEDGVLELEEEV